VLLVDKRLFAGVAELVRKPFAGSSRLYPRS